MPASRASRSKARQEIQQDAAAKQKERPQQEVDAEARATVAARKGILATDWVEEMHKLLDERMAEAVIQIQATLDNTKATKDQLREQLSNLKQNIVDGARRDNLQGNGDSLTRTLTRQDKVLENAVANKRMAAQTQAGDTSEARAAAAMAHAETEVTSEVVAKQRAELDRLREEFEAEKAEEDRKRDEERDEAKRVFEERQKVLDAKDRAARDKAREADLDVALETNAAKPGTRGQQATEESLQQAKEAVTEESAADDAPVDPPENPKKRRAPRVKTQKEIDDAADKRTALNNAKKQRVDASTDYDTWAAYTHPEDGYLADLEADLKEASEGLESTTLLYEQQKSLNKTLNQQLASNFTEIAQLKEAAKGKYDETLKEQLDATKKELAKEKDDVMRALRQLTWTQSYLDKHGGAQAWRDHIDKKKSEYKEKAAAAASKAAEQTAAAEADL